MGDFSASYPAIDTTNDAVAPGGTITGASGLPYRPPTHPDSHDPSNADDGGEPAPIRAWREKRDAALAHRDE
ncbi:Clathrin light chain, partial [Teratosphaeriaceae sp. CCFEE 6253]